MTPFFHPEIFVFFLLKTSTRPLTPSFSWGPGRRNYRESQEPLTQTFAFSQTRPSGECQEIIRSSVHVWKQLHVLLHLLCPIRPWAIGVDVIVRDCFSSIISVETTRCWVQYDRTVSPLHHVGLSQVSPPRLHARGGQPGQGAYKNTSQPLLLSSVTATRPSVQGEESVFTDKYLWDHFKQDCLTTSMYLYRRLCACVRTWVHMSVNEKTKSSLSVWVKSMCDPYQQLHPVL